MQIIAYIQVATKQRLASLRLASLLLGCALLLTACSGSAVSTLPLTDLTLPGVVKIASVNALEQRIGAHRIDELIPYRNPNDRQMHVVFQARATYYDATLDGKRLDPLTSSCLEDLAITSDGHWGICVAIHEKTLAIHDFTGHTADHTVAVDTSAMDYPGNVSWVPSWAPDSQRLALVSRLGGGCSIAVYQGVPPYTHLDLVVILSLPELVVNTAVGLRCSVGGLSWSPDGKWLTFGSTHPAGYYALALSSLNLDTTVAHELPITKEIHMEQLLPLHAGDIRELTWSHKPDVVTYGGNYGQDIEETNILTGQHTQLLSQQVAEILTLAWTPDGKQLVFVLGLPTVDITPPFPQMYVYTPPVGKSRD
jgi:WD40 repeat protein